MGVKAVARQVRNASGQSLRRALLRRRLLALQKMLSVGRTPDQRFVGALARSWGNEAWSASEQLLLATLKWLPHSCGPILECGSGLSTLVLATAARLSARRLISIEHDPEWASRVTAAMQPDLRPYAQIEVVPLRDYGRFDWYDMEQTTTPADIGFVLCDGPPGSTRGGRYGFGPLLSERLSPDCIVLLDDTQRPQERSIVDRWCAELSGVIVEEGATFTVMKVNSGSALKSAV